MIKKIMHRCCALTIIIGLTMVVYGEEYIIPDIEVEEPDFAMIEPWEDLDINQQYCTAMFEGIEYDSNTGKMNQDIIENNLGKELGTAEMLGWDEINSKEYFTNSSVYEINGISRECAVAIQFDIRPEYYVYYNAYYRPETLGDFIDDLNLTENLKLGAAHYEYLVEERPMYETIVYEEYEDFDDIIAWENLLDNRSAPNIGDGQGVFYEPFTMSANIPVLGIENLSMGLTEEGYLKTNLLATAKIFIIGDGKAEKFIELLSTM